MVPKMLCCCCSFSLSQLMEVVLAVVCAQINEHATQKLQELWVWRINRPCIWTGVHNFQIHISMKTHAEWRVPCTNIDGNFSSVYVAAAATATAGACECSPHSCAFLFFCSAFGFVCFFALAQIDAWNAVCLFYKHHLDISLQKKIHMSLMLSFDLFVSWFFFFCLIFTNHKSKNRKITVFSNIFPFAWRKFSKYFDEHRNVQQFKNVWVPRFHRE